MIVRFQGSYFKIKILKVLRDILQLDPEVWRGHISRYKRNWTQFNGYFNRQKFVIWSLWSFSGECYLKMYPLSYGSFSDPWWKFILRNFSNRLCEQWGYKTDEGYEFCWTKWFWNHVQNSFSSFFIQSVSIWMYQVDQTFDIFTGIKYSKTFRKNLNSTNCYKIS